MATNPLTGSVLVVHEEGLPLESLRQPFLDCWDGAGLRNEEPAQISDARLAPVPTSVEMLPVPQARAAQTARDDVDLAAIIVDVGLAAIMRQPPMRLIEWAATRALRAVIESARQPQARYA